MIFKKYQKNLSAYSFLSVGYRKKTPCPHVELSPGLLYPPETPPYWQSFWITAETRLSLVSLVFFFNSCFCTRLNLHQLPKETLWMGKASLSETWDRICNSCQVKVYIKTTICKNIASQIGFSLKLCFQNNIIAFLQNGCIQSPLHWDYISNCIFKPLNSFSGEMHSYNFSIIFPPTNHNFKRGVRARLTGKKDDQPNSQF